MKQDNLQGDKCSCHLHLDLLSQKDDQVDVYLSYKQKHEQDL